MKTGLRSTASIVLGLLLWIILYLAFCVICLLVLTSVPAVVNFVMAAIKFLHVDHWYAILLMGIPAIVPAIIVKQIMKGTSEKAQKWTLITLIATTAIAIMVLNAEAFSLLGKLEGIFGVGLVFWTLGKEDLGNTYHVSIKSIIPVLLTVVIISSVILYSQNNNIEASDYKTSTKQVETVTNEAAKPARSYSKTYKVAGVTFNNDNGTSRQKALSDLMAVYGEWKDIPCRLVEYKYQGNTAFYVYVGTKIIGNIPADDVAEVKRLLPDIERATVQISKFKPDGETIYYARVTIDYK